MNENMIEALQYQIDRNRRLAEEYESIPTGGFGAGIIRSRIVEAEQAITSGDTIEIFRLYKVLSETE